MYDLLCWLIIWALTERHLWQHPQYDQPKSNAHGNLFLHRRTHQSTPASSRHLSLSSNCWRRRSLSVRSPLRILYSQNYRSACESPDRCIPDQENSIWGPGWGWWSLSCWRWPWLWFTDVLVVVRSGDSMGLCIYSLFWIVLLCK